MTAIFRSTAELEQSWWVFLVLGLIGWVIALGMAWAWKEFRDSTQHLMNAYRLELGEPPLWPDHWCPMCNPQRWGDNGTVAERSTTPDNGSGSQR